ncbi:MAG TPA: hypothetical protein VN694_14060 [Caulobacteraceae bacterium]|nr:hypothetical protein [Caulobacteraceae bacterium]
MRHATLLAAAAIVLTAVQPALAKAPAKAAAPAAAPAPAGAPPSSDPTVNDMRCIVVAGALLQSDDEQMKSVGRASLFYYLGRLQGRGDTANMNARIVGEAAKMTEDDIKTQSKTCGATFTAAAQALQDLSNAFQQHFGGQGAGAAAPK